MNKKRKVGRPSKKDIQREKNTKIISILMLIFAIGLVGFGIRKFIIDYGTSLSAAVSKSSTTTSNKCVSKAGYNTTYHNGTCYSCPSPLKYNKTAGDCRGKVNRCPNEGDWKTGYCYHYYCNTKAGYNYIGSNTCQKNVCSAAQINAGYKEEKIDGVIKCVKRNWICPNSYNYDSNSKKCTYKYIKKVCPAGYDQNYNSTLCRNSKTGMMKAKINTVAYHTLNPTWGIIDIQEAQGTTTQKAKKVTDKPTGTYIKVLKEVNKSKPRKR